MKINVIESNSKEDVNVIFAKAFEEGRKAALKMWEGYHGKD